MSDKKLLSLSDFEWASAARYIVYISSMANLKEINSNHVISFPLGKLGPDKLLKQKRRALILLEGNLSAIAAFVGEHQHDLGVNEMAVLRTLYVQYKNSMKTVTGHIKVIGALMIEVELGLLQSPEVSEDDALF